MYVVEQKMELLSLLACVHNSLVGALLYPRDGKKLLL